MQLSFYSVFFVALGGALGAVSRYLVGIASLSLLGIGLYGTAIVNILGCFLMGVLSEIINSYSELNRSLYLQPLFAIGFCGSFTTMSAFVYDINKLLSENSIIFLIMYVIFNLLGSLVFYYLGTAVLRQSNIII